MRTPNNSLLQLSLLLLAMVVATTIACQGCGIEGYEDNTAFLDDVANTRPTGWVVGTFQLVNVSSTETLPHHHNQYLEAHRYENGTYDLVTTDAFPHFIDGGGWNYEMTRRVRLYCNDGISVVLFTFVLPVFGTPPPTTPSLISTTPRFVQYRS